MRAGLNRLSHLEPARPDNRYEHEAPGDLLHLDIKKLGRFKRPGHRVTGTRQHCKNRGAGWEYVHVAIDDHSRIAFSSIHSDETGKSVCEALIKAVRYYRGLGIRYKRVLTDNRSGRFRRLCQRLGLVHRRTRPYSPRTNGKAERFIQTILREWAYARSYESSEQRARHLLPWLHQYDWHRPHASLDYQPPISRSGLSVNNLLSSHSQGASIPSCARKLPDWRAQSSAYSPPFFSMQRLRLVGFSPAPVNKHPQLQSDQGNTEIQ